MKNAKLYLFFVSKTTIRSSSMSKPMGKYLSELLIINAEQLKNSLS